jgi:hypothetical protein
MENMAIMVTMTTEKNMVTLLMILAMVPEVTVLIL